MTGQSEQDKKVEAVARGLAATYMKGRLSVTEGRRKLNVLETSEINNGLVKEFDRRAVAGYVEARWTMWQAAAARLLRADVEGAMSYINQ